MIYCTRLNSSTTRLSFIWPCLQLWHDCCLLFIQADPQFLASREIPYNPWVWRKQPAFQGRKKWLRVESVRGAGQQKPFSKYCAICLVFSWGVFSSSTKLCSQGEKFLWIYFFFAKKKKICWIFLLQLEHFSHFSFLSIRILIAMSSQSRVRPKNLSLKNSKNYNKKKNVSINQILTSLHTTVSANDNTSWVPPLSPDPLSPHTHFKEFTGKHLSISTHLLQRLVCVCIYK